MVHTSSFPLLLAKRKIPEGPAEEPPPLAPPEIVPPLDPEDPLLPPEDPDFIPEERIFKSFTDCISWIKENLKDSN